MGASIEQTIARIRAFASERGWTKSRLAREAGLQDTTLRHFDRPDWNPTVETLRAIERVIPADWQPAPAEQEVA